MSSSSRFKKILRTRFWEASAPCRVDMGGTLDIATFHYPLRHLSPCTFNLAVDLRTRVRLSPYDPGKVKVFSKGYGSDEFDADRLPFDHPFGLFLAAAAYFQADGIAIDVASAAPPQSGLGGSSVAAVALVAAFAAAAAESGWLLKRRHIVQLAFMLESSVAGVLCGIQDQLAAVYGGIHLWHWTARPDEPAWRREPLQCESPLSELETHLLLVYGGVPHTSGPVNERWGRQFLSGSTRRSWAQIIDLTHRFTEAFRARHYAQAGDLLNQEMALRREMTPDVLDEFSSRLWAAAVEERCGARITGAGAGGCLWAVGECADIQRLRRIWQDAVDERPEATLLDFKIAADGVRSAAYCQTHWSGSD